MNPLLTISLKLKKRISPLDSVIFLEDVNIKRLNAITNSCELSTKFDLSNYSQIIGAQSNAHEKAQLQAYAKKYDKKLNACLLFPPAGLSRLPAFAAVCKISLSNSHVLSTCENLKIENARIPTTITEEVSQYRY